MPLVGFTAGNVIVSDDVDANFALCVLTDTPRTITVTHTWSAIQTFSGGVDSTGSTPSDVGTVLYRVNSWDAVGKNSSALTLGGFHGSQFTGVDVYASGTKAIAVTSTVVTFPVGATVSSGQTLTVTDATITGLTAASVGTGTFPSGTYGFTGATTLTGGAGNMIVVAGTGNSRTLVLQTTTSGGVATTALTISDTQTVAFAKSVTITAGSLSPTLTTGVQAVFSGYAIATAAATTGSGSIQLGTVLADAGHISYDDAGNTTLYIDNTYNNNSSAIKFRTKTQGNNNATTVVGLSIAGDGALTAVTSLTVGTGFGCNTKAAQSAFASGGALNAYGAGANGLDSGANMSALHALVVAIRAALVADGIMS